MSLLEFDAALECVSPSRGGKHVQAGFWKSVCTRMYKLEVPYLVEASQFVHFQFVHEFELVH